MNEEELKERLDRIEKKLDELLRRPMLREQIAETNRSFYEGIWMEQKKKDV